MNQKRKILFEKLEEALSFFLCAESPKGEQWHPSYKKDKESFYFFIKSNVRTEKLVGKVFKEQAKRANDFVKWKSVLSAVEMAEVPDKWVFPLTAVVWEEIRKMLHSSLESGLGLALKAGGSFTEKEVGIVVGWSEKSKPAVDYLNVYGAELVKGINKETRERMKSVLKIGVELGENQKEITKRLEEVIYNKPRASIIARTEAVRAYNQAKLMVAEETGLRYVKVWEDGQAGACKLCQELDGNKVNLKGVFATGIESPPAHPSCKCGMHLELEV